MKRFWLMALMTILVWFLPFPLSAQDNIKVGGSMALSGPLEVIGSNVLTGIEAYLNRVNQEGGVKGRKVEYVVYDDSYSPAITIKNVKRLMLKDEVVALLGVMGTPSTLAVMGMVRAMRVPLVGPITGSETLRTEGNRYIFTVMPSYRDGIEALVRRAVADGHRKLAIIYKKDAYGWSCLRYAMDALKPSGIVPVIRGRVDSLQKVEEVLLKVKQAKPDALLVVVTPEVSKALVSVMLKHGYFPPVYANMWAGFDGALKGLDPQDLGKFKRVVVSKIFPMPFEDYPLIKAYRKDLARYFPDTSPDIKQIPGYVAARVFVGILRRANSFTSQGIVKAAESVKDLDIGLPEKISYGPEDHVGFSRIYLYAFTGKYKRLQ